VILIFFLAKAETISFGDALGFVARTCRTAAILFCFMAPSFVQDRRYKEINLRVQGSKRQAGESGFESSGCNDTSQNVAINSAGSRSALKRHGLPDLISVSFDQYSQPLLHHFKLGLRLADLRAEPEIGFLSIRNPTLGDLRVSEEIPSRKSQDELNCFSPFSGSRLFRFERVAALLDIRLVRLRQLMPFRALTH
jgi:hypothetical protein